jgi:hypothetical protein
MTAVVFYPQAINFAQADVPITQLTNVSAMYAFSDVVEFSSGDVAPFWSGSLQSAPACPFGSRQVKSLLDLCDPGAAHAKGKSYVAHDGTASTCDLFYRKGVNYGLRIADATASHELLRMTRGFYRWDSITANQGAVAEINGVLAAGWDGTNDPLVDTQAALTENEAVNHLFTLGPLTINGTDVDGVQSVTWSNNNQPELVFDQGIPFPTYLGIARYNPQIVARVRNGTLLRTFSSRGTALTSLSFYLRKLKASDLCEANVDAVHIKFTASAGTVKARQIDSRGLVALHIQIQKATADGYAFTYDTTSAIT